MIGPFSLEVSPAIAEGRFTENEREPKQGEVVMDRKENALAMMEPGPGIIESKSDVLRQTLRKLDEMMDEFSEIQVGLIQDEGDNP